MNAAQSGAQRGRELHRTGPSRVSAAPAQPACLTLVRRLGWVFLGLRTTIFPARDLAAAKEWFTKAFGVSPYFDEPFYVGFEIGGYELGLDPDAPVEDGPTTYWGVEDADAAVAHLLASGARAHKPVREVGDGIRVATVRTPDGFLLGVIENPHFGTR
jgi:predicted enzyme related to lactoylglutathione lyase